MDADFTVFMARERLSQAQARLVTKKARLLGLTAQHDILKKAEASITMIYNDPQLMFQFPTTSEAQEWNALSSKIWARCLEWRRDLSCHQLKVDKAHADIRLMEAEVKNLRKELEVVQRDSKQRGARERQERERQEREREAREREKRAREAQAKEAQERERLRKEATARERLREQIREQQAKEEKGRRERAAWEETMRRDSAEITTQRAKRYQQQATYALKNYASLISFPDPLSEPCKNIACQRDSDRALRACACNIKKCFVGLTARELKEWRNKWHPDKFARCQGGRKMVEVMQRKAKEVFQVLKDMQEEAAAREKC